MKVRKKLIESRRTDVGQVSDRVACIKLLLFMCLRTRWHGKALGLRIWLIAQLQPSGNGTTGELGWCVVNLGGLWGCVIRVRVAGNADGWIRTTDLGLINPSL